VDLGRWLDGQHAIPGPPAPTPGAASLPGVPDDEED
jgi:endogenous inhibitor of DNA gyrase (YacG/DUF329 family)